MLQQKLNSLDPEAITVPHRIIQSWYTGRWWVGCYIWYSKEGPEWAAPHPPHCTKLTAHPSAASVPITVVLLYDGLLLCGFNVAIKGLTGWLLIWYRWFLYRFTRAAWISGRQSEARNWRYSLSSVQPLMSATSANCIGSVLPVCCDWFLSPRQSEEWLLPATCSVMFCFIGNYLVYAGC